MALTLMSRPLRIEYPNAWYHVMNRGRRAEKIFKDETDNKVFVGLLKESAETWNVNIAAYCLIPNHYHILVNTPDANISRYMRHLNGYTPSVSIVVTIWMGRYSGVDINQ